MLSSVAAKLTRLILARHSLILQCDRAGVDTRGALDSQGRKKAASEANDPQLSTVSADRAALAELMLLPQLLDHVEAVIVYGWKELARARPKV
jgi:hypothetical protein